NLRRVQTALDVRGPGVHPSGRRILRRHPPPRPARFRGTAGSSSRRDVDRGRARSRDPRHSAEPARRSRARRLRSHRHRLRLDQRPALGWHEVEGPRAEPGGRPLAGEAGGVTPVRAATKSKKLFQEWAPASKTRENKHFARFLKQRPEIRLETRRFLGRRPEFLAVCRVVELKKLSAMNAAVFIPSIQRAIDANRAGYRECEGFT